MQGLQGAPLAALDSIVNARPEAWTVSDAGTLGVLSASLAVPIAGQEVGFSVSVTGWTREELHHRISLIRDGAAALLERPEGAPER